MCPLAVLKATWNGLEGSKVLGRGVWESDKGVLRLSKMNDAPDLLLGYPPNKRKEQQ